MTTAQDMIQEALEWIGAYAPGQPMNAADSSRGLIVLNNMLDSWSNENLACYQILEQSLIYTPGKSAYTIGTTGTPDVSATRPLGVVMGPGSAYTQDFNGNIYGMDVITRQDWNLRGSRNTNSNFPDVLFYDPKFPLGVLNFDPIPNIGYTAYWDSYLQISDFAGLTTALSMPPGYEIAIKRNLGVELFPFYFPGREPTPQMVQNAATTKAAVKRTNIRPNVVKYDPEVTARAPGIYNIYTDSYRR